MKRRIYLTVCSIVLTVLVMLSAAHLFAMDVVAAPPNQGAATATATATRTATAARTVTVAPTADANASAPTETPFPAVEIGDILRIEYDKDSNTIYINAENPNVKIVVGGYPLETSSSAPQNTPVPTQPAQALSAADLRGKIVFLSDRDGGDFLSSGKYYAINPDGTGLQTLPYDSAKELMSQLRPLEGFSPDHAKVVLGERNCQPNPYGATCALYILDTLLDAGQIFSGADPSHGEWFVQNNKRAREPVWSPRGDYIVFVSSHEPPEGCRNTDNLFKGTVGQKPVFRRLTNFCGGQGGMGQPSFSADGSQVVFWSSFEDGSAHLYKIDVGADDTFDWRTAQPIQVTADGGNDWQPIWVK